MRLYGLSMSIISDRDIKFVSYFWKVLWAKMGTCLKFSSAFHPQTKVQIESVNRSLENLLQCLVMDHNTTRDLLLPHAKFFYKSLVNRGTSRSPSEVITSHQPHMLDDLISLPLPT